MSGLRFFAYIHSIVGESVMIQPQQNSPIIERGSVQDFQSMIPVNEPFRFCFHVKPERAGMYDGWLNPPSRTERRAPRMPQNEDYNNAGGESEMSAEDMVNRMFQDKPL